MMSGISAIPCRKTLIILALMVSANHAIGETDSTDNLLQTSINLSDNGHYDLALIGIEKFLSLSESSQEGWYLKGKILSGKGQHQEAIKAYDMALSIDPFKPDYWMSRGMSLENLNRYPEAIVCYNRAIDCYESGLIKPELTFEEGIPTLRIPMAEHFMAWYYKGRDYKRIGRYQDAIDCFDRSILLYEKGQADTRSDIFSENELFSAVQLEKGITLLYLANAGDAGRYEDAIRCFNVTIKNSTNSTLQAEAWYDLGLTKQFLKDSKSAEICFDESIKEDNSSKAWAPWFSKGIVLRNLGLQREANDAFEKATDRAMELNKVKKTSLLDVLWSLLGKHLPFI